MSEKKYLKCPCRHCGGSIEFPAQGIGMAVNCPHCQSKTTLFAPPVSVEPEQTEAEQEPNVSPPRDSESTEATDVSTAAQPESVEKTSSRKLVVVGLLLAVCGAVGFGFWRWKAGTREASPRPTETQAISRKHRPESAAAGAPPTPSTPSTSAPSSPSAPAASISPAVPKSLDDFKVGAISLEKAKGNSLVYAVGTLKNSSDYQRFGVKLELDLTDAAGAKVGIAKDYRSVLEPRQEWRFRALILVPKAVAATVSSIREDE